MAGGAAEIGRFDGYSIFTSGVGPYRASAHSAGLRNLPEPGKKQGRGSVPGGRSDACCCFGRFGGLSVEAGNCRGFVIETLQNSVDLGKA